MNAHNTILKRVWSVTSAWYFKMASGEHIKPETAVRRRLVTQAALDAAMREEEDKTRAVREELIRRQGK